MNITPAMKQYYDMKASYSDAILFFRMGDFYEMFEDDAKIAHRVLGIALTTRNKNSQTPVLLAGIPYHAKEKYLPLLIDAGYKVAIAEQVSDPKAKGIVQREVQRVVTPATLSLEGEGYEQSDAAIMVSLVSQNNMYGMSVINISQHTWKCSEFHDFESCAGELYKLSPSEIILEKHMFGDTRLQEILEKKYGLNIYYYQSAHDPYTFLTSKFATKSLKGYGIEDKKLAQAASNLILSYISENQKSELNFLQNLSYETFSGYMDLDESTIKSLDVIYNLATNSGSIGTLFGALNTTLTPMGKRFLREEILHPLIDRKEIMSRQKFISALKSDTILLDTIRCELKKVSDLDAILTRLSLERAGPRDLLNLKNSLIAIREVFDCIKKSKNKELQKLILI